MEDGRREMGGERDPIDHVHHLSDNAENQNDVSELETEMAGFREQCPFAENILWETKGFET